MIVVGPVAQKDVEPWSSVEGNRRSSGDVSEVEGPLEASRSRQSQKAVRVVPDGPARRHLENAVIREVLDDRLRTRSGDREGRARSSRRSDREIGRSVELREGPGRLSPSRERVRSHVRPAPEKQGLDRIQVDASVRVVPLCEPVVSPVHGEELPVRRSRSADRRLPDVRLALSPALPEVRRAVDPPGVPDIVSSDHMENAVRIGASVDH